MNSSPILQRLSAARTALVLDHPFFGALALRLTPVESTLTETMATDGRSLFYSPAYVASISDVELLGVYAHEVMHPAMQHHTRREGRDARRWNEAADYAINPMLIAAGFSLPQGVLLDSRYAGLSAEQIYDLLPKPQNGGSQQPGEVLDAPEPDQDAAEWQVAVKQAVQAAKMMGTLPAEFAKQIAEQTAPIVDWRSLLRRFVQQTAAADYSWKAPNRRYTQHGIYLPSIKSESMPPVVLMFDTSASTQPYRATFAAEVQSIVEETQPEAVYVVYADSVVHRVDKFERGEPVEISTVGEGGTDFRPAFDWVEREGLSPACAIYLTDGDGAYPAQAPDYPVLWAMTESRSAPWGETVEVRS